VLNGYITLLLFSFLTLLLSSENYTRAYLYSIFNEEVAKHLITIHNLHYQLNLMSRIRESIISDTFPEFVVQFMKDLYPNNKYPAWAVDALSSVNITLL
jgi:hypothetical protein